PPFEMHIDPAVDFTGCNAGGKRKVETVHDPRLEQPEKPVKGGFGLSRSCLRLSDNQFGSRFIRIEIGNGGLKRSGGKIEASFKTGRHLVEYWSQRSDIETESSHYLRNRPSIMGKPLAEIIRPDRKPCRVRTYPVGKHQEAREAML